MLQKKLLALNISATTLTKDAVNKCNVDIRNDLYKNVVLAGGSTMFDGIVEIRKRVSRCNCTKF